MGQEKEDQNNAGPADFSPGYDPSGFTLASVASELPDLITALASFDGVQSVSVLAGLLTVPAYQPCALRLETLACLAAAHARGSRSVCADDVDKWLAQISASSIGRFEDPPEDLFVSRVTDSKGDHRVLTGRWENAPFYTQLVAEVVESMPSAERLLPIKRAVAAVLVLSDLICERAHLGRYDTGADVAPVNVDADVGKDISEVSHRVMFTGDDLRAAGIDPADIAPFLLSRAEVASLPAEAIHVSALHNRPLLLLPGDRYLVALPASLTLALRSFVIDAMEGGEALFDRAFHFFTDRSLAVMPFLGGQGIDHIVWADAAGYGLGNAVIEVDEGHILNVGFILPSVHAHADGRFLTPFRPSPGLQSRLEQAQLEAIELAQARPGFQRGLQLWIICGWGRGFEVRLPDLPYNGWHTAALSIAALARISFTKNMSPAYLWKAMDGHRTIEEAGLNLVNMSGVPNILAWMRQNDGHFVPHRQMLDSHISPEHPADFIMPTNALRNLYIECDQGMDVHAAFDPAGVLHHLQRPSNEPLFKFEGAEQLYVSLSAAMDGRMVVMFEGKGAYWVTVEAPRLESLRSDLLDVVTAWLPRIALCLDEKLEVRGLSSTKQVRRCMLPSQRSQSFTRFAASATNTTGSFSG